MAEQSNITKLNNQGQRYEVVIIGVTLLQTITTGSKIVL